MRPCLVICVSLCSAGVALGLTGCRKSFKNVNDDLRAERLELQRKVAELEGQLELRTAELEAQRQKNEGEATPLPGVEPLHPVKLKMDRYSAALDTDGDGSDDTVRVYVQPLDAKGRFLPVPAKATVQLVRIEKGQDPQTLVEKTFEPDEFDAAYRSGFTGTHYTLELPLPADLPGNVKEATVKVTLTEGVTGVELTEQQVVRITRK